MSVDSLGTRKYFSNYKNFMSTKGKGLCNQGPRHFNTNKSKTTVVKSPFPRLTRGFEISHETVLCITPSIRGGTSRFTKSVAVYGTSDYSQDPLGTPSLERVSLSLPFLSPCSPLPPTDPRVPRRWKDVRNDCCRRGDVWGVTPVSSYTPLPTSPGISSCRTTSSCVGKRSCTYRSLTHFTCSS